MWLLSDNPAYKMLQPNLSAIIEQWWGGSYQDYALRGIIISASNLVWGTNPPYGPNEFFSMYPRFGGDLVEGLVGTLVQNSPNVLVPDSEPLEDLQPFQYISDLLGNIPPATQITLITGQNLIISNPATSGAVGDNLQVYMNPLVPVPVLVTFINLASACVQYARWLELWQLGMSLFVAHYCTLWLDSENQPGGTPGQVAGAGLANGILTSKSAGDVSAGYSPISGMEEWGAWQLTTYGQQFATLAKIVGWGPMYVW